jgi:hypothetical protein
MYSICRAASITVNNQIDMMRGGHLAAQQRGRTVGVDVVLNHPLKGPAAVHAAHAAVCTTEREAIDNILHRCK